MQAATLLGPCLGRELRTTLLFGRTYSHHPTTGLSLPGPTAGAAFWGCAWWVRTVQRGHLRVDWRVHSFSMKCDSGRRG